MASEPIVIVDGIRVDATQDATVVDIKVSSSRIDDIAPEEIARIDVLPGPAAAGLYGPGAAGGALLITTKHGSDGALHVGGRIESGVGLVHTSWPANYQLVGISATTGQSTRCILATVADGTCTPTRLDTWNPLEKVSPFRTARTAAGSMSVTGGGKTSARVGLTGNRTLGVTPDDDDRRFGLRVNVDRNFGNSFAITGNAGYVRTSSGIPVRGDIIDGSNVIANGLFGYAVPDTNQGYRQTNSSTVTREHVRHWTAGASARWTAFDWLMANALYGRDFVTQHDHRSGTFTGQSGGFTTDELGRFDHSLTTVDISATTADWTVVNPSIRARTTIGYQQLRSVLHATDTVPFGFAFLDTKWRSGGEWLRQQFAWHDRVSFGATIRRERWSAYGAKLPTHFYKSADAAWWLGRALGVDSLRLRAAYGEAGNWSPGQPRRVGAAGGFSSPNPELLAPEERTAESEMGVDFAFANLARFSITAFRADASHLYVFEPPNGSPFPPPASSVGKLRNEGLEIASNVLLLDIGGFRWEASLTASALRNRATSIGPFNVFILTQNGIIRVGEPVNSYWIRPYSYADINHDGLIGRNEVQGLGLSPTAVGSSLPTREASALSKMRLMSGLSFSALFDYRGGQKLSNRSEAIRCGRYIDCRAVNDRTTSLAEQAQALIGFDPYVEDASFLKLRELSLHYLLPSRVSALVGAPMTVTFAGRQLATWTHYRGPDPELNEQPLNVLPRLDVADTPLAREILLRLDIGGGSPHDR